MGSRCSRWRGCGAAGRSGAGDGQRPVVRPHPVLRSLRPPHGASETDEGYEVRGSADPASCAEGVAWWERLCAAGGEGAVVKPVEGLRRGPRGLVQPALKVRGPEYLRLVYGPDYLAPANLPRLRDRDLGRKRSLALREHTLGVEALQRLDDREPLWRVHEAVVAVLALESDPVDPRL